MHAMQTTTSASIEANASAPIIATVHSRTLADFAELPDALHLSADPANPCTERYMHAFVDAAPIAKLLLDADGRVLYANRAAKAFLRTLNPQHTERLLQSVRDCHPDLLPGDAMRVCEECGTWAGEVAIRDAAGQERMLRLYIVALGTDRGAPFGLTVCDITLEYMREEQLHERNIELEKACARLESAQEQVIQTEKLASIGQLAAGVAHEINNPIGYVKSNLNSLKQYIAQLLTAIHAYAAVTAAPGDAGALARLERTCQQCNLDYLAVDTQQLLDETREGIDRVCKIVRDLKDFSRRDHADDWVLADVHEGLESTLNIVWNELKYKAQVIKTFGELPMIECLPSELNQVFMNLLINAGQAIQKHGIITIGTEHCGNAIRICIGDDGDGIPEELLPRIFDPFFTTKPVGSGTGLGLSISYGIVAKHHGTIEVTSLPGSGTMFQITLPVSQAQPLRER